MPIKKVCLRSFILRYRSSKLKTKSVVWFLSSTSVNLKSVTSDQSWKDLAMVFLLSKDYLNPIKVSKKYFYSYLTTRKSREIDGFNIL